MKAPALLALAALALAACATTPSRPAAEVSLGDWRRASPPATLSQFSASVARRYPPGTPLESAARDLTANAFSCTTPAPARRGAPPARVCRRTLNASGCAHTWQVHLFGAAALTRARALYDRTCGSDGLLGGPT